NWMLATSGGVILAGALAAGGWVEFRDRPAPPSNPVPVVRTDQSPLPKDQRVNSDPLRGYPGSPDPPPKPNAPLPPLDLIDLPARVKVGLTGAGQPVAVTVARRAGIGPVHVLMRAEANGAATVTPET